MIVTSNISACADIDRRSGYDNNTGYGGQDSDVGNQDGDSNLSSNIDGEYYTIYTYESGYGSGYIIPGDTDVPAGGSQVFYIEPDSDSYIIDVLVDGDPQGNILSYEFSDVNEDHEIEAIFGLMVYDPRRRIYVVPW